MSKISLDSALCERAGNWIYTAWRTLPPRHEGLFWDTAGERAIRANLETHRIFKGSWFTMNNVSWSARNFHNLCKDSDFWGKDHKGEFWTENSNHRLNLAALVMAGNIAFNIAAINKKVELPERKNKDSINEGVWGLDSLEYKVRWHIEHAWKTRYDSIIDALRWQETTQCALDAVYATVQSLDDASNETTLKTIASLTHENMMKYGLWGEDNANPDRVYPNGRVKMFVDLSPEMQEYYVLIALAALSGISDFQAKQKLGKDPYLVLLETK